MKNSHTHFLKLTAVTIITLFMSSTVFAQVQQDTSARDTSNQQQTSPQEQYQRTDTKDYDKGVDYSETLDKNELPQEVNNSLDELYPAHDISEVFRGDDDSFKVKVKNENDQAVVYYSSDGDFLRAENLSGLQQEGAFPQEQGQRTQESQDQDQWGTDERGNQQGTQIETDTESRRDNEGTDRSTMGTDTDDKDHKMRNESSAYPQKQSQHMGDDMRSNMDKMHDKGIEYSKKLDKSELPQEVTSSLDELYSAHEIEEIHRGDDDSYKVKVKNQDDVAVVYYSSEGDFLRAENKSDTRQGANPQQQGQRINETQRNQQETQENQWGTQDNNQGTATPQEQSQRTEEQDDDLSMQGERRTDSEWGADNPSGTRANRTGSESERTDNQYGTTMETDTTGQSMGQDRGVSPQEQSQEAGDDKEYSEEVGKNDLPELITNSVDELYPDYEIKKAYRANDGSYKIKIENQDEKVALFYDSSGYFVRDEKKSEMKDTNEDW